MTKNLDLTSFSSSVRNKVDLQLEKILQLGADKSELTSAMRYATLGGGKRIRPLLCFASAQLFNTQSLVSASVLSSACALELIHAYSLVHDDLPAMDDDDLRRGQATTHKQFDEATAILAGDALQALAFEILAGAPEMQNSKQHSTHSSVLAQSISTLALASGKSGMVGGQMIDVESVGKSLSLESLIEMHSMKTGALISASIRLGALAGGCEDSDHLKSLDKYASQIGLAFQIKDDILDCTSSTEILGKTQGSDAELDKPTYVSLLGLEGAQQKLDLAQSTAIQALEDFGENTLLAQIADYIVSRTH